MYGAGGCATEEPYVCLIQYINYLLSKPNPPKTAVLISIHPSLAKQVIYLKYILYPQTLTPILISTCMLVVKPVETVICKIFKARLT